MARAFRVVEIPNGDADLVEASLTKADADGFKAEGGPLALPDGSIMFIFTKADEPAAQPAAQPAPAAPAAPTPAQPAPSAGQN